MIHSRKIRFANRVDQNDQASTAKEEQLSTTHEKEMVLLNSKVQLFLTCALSMSEYDRIKEKKTAIEI